MSALGPSSCCCGESCFRVFCCCCFCCCPGKLKRAAKTAGDLVNGDHRPKIKYQSLPANEPHDEAPGESHYYGNPAAPPPYERHTEQHYNRKTSATIDSSYEDLLVVQDQVLREQKFRVHQRPWSISGPTVGDMELGADRDDGSGGSPPDLDPLSSSLPSATVAQFDTATRVCKTQPRGATSLPRVTAAAGKKITVKRSRSKTLPNITNVMEPLPTIEFSVFYDFQRYSLTVHIVQAFDLPALDRCGTSDPFVVLYLSPNKEEIFETAVIKRLLDPVFNQSFVFKGLLPDEVKRQSLVLRVYDHDRVSKNDFIGSVTLPLERADLYGTKTVLKIEVGNKDIESRGDLLFSLAYHHASQKLEGVLVKITNLSKNDVLGSGDPYVKVYLLLNNVRKDKWKSTIKKNTLMPVFNESFQFDLSDMDLANVMLQFSVMDYDRFTQNDVIGVFSVGGRAPSKVGRDHWSQVMSSHGHAVSHWHSLEKKDSKTQTQYSLSGLNDF